MRTVWRITTARFAQTAFSGEGARLYGGRWNPKGWEVVYTAESQSLGLLELMVQDDPLRAHYVLIAAQLPGDLPETRINIEQLPDDWRTIGARDVLQSMGQAWLQGAQTALLSAPSAVVPAERNILINPRHPDFARIVLGPPSPCILILACCAILATPSDSRSPCQTNCLQWFRMQSPYLSGLRLPQRPAHGRHQPRHQRIAHQKPSL